MKKTLLIAVCSLLVCAGCGKKSPPAAAGPLFKNAGIRTTVQGRGMSDWILGVKGHSTHAGFVVSNKYLGSANGADRISVAIHSDSQQNAFREVRIVEYRGELLEVYRNDQIVIEIHPTQEQ